MRTGQSSLRPELVISVLGDVAHPGQGLVSRLLNDLQIPHLQQHFLLTIFSHHHSHFYLNTRRCKVWDLKLDIDGRLAFGEVAVYTGEEELGLDEIMIVT